MLLNSQRLNYTVHILDHVKNLISVDTHVNQHLKQMILNLIADKVQC